MTNRVIVDRIRRLAPAASFVFSGDCCTHATFTDRNDIYFGVIRHHSSSDKATILRLLSELEGLTHLDLRKNRLGPLLDSLGNLSRLTHLDLASNYMGTVPSWLKNLRELVFLNLGVNELEELPEFLETFTKLRVLKLHKNPRLSRLPNFALMSELRFLNLFLLPKMDLIPSCFASLTELEFFSCGMSSAEELPEDLFIKWPNLVWLSIVSTKIRALPSHLGQLHRLRGLRLPKNALQELPDDIGELAQLEQLSVFQNQLKSLPPSMTKLKNLKILNVAENPCAPRIDLSTLPLEWVKA